MIKIITGDVIESEKLDPETKSGLIGRLVMFLTRIVPEGSLPQLLINGGDSVIHFSPVCADILCQTDPNTDNGPTSLWCRRPLQENRSQLKREEISRWLEADN